MDLNAPPSAGTRRGYLAQFLWRNLFRVRLENGVAIVAVMADELIPSIDPNVPLSRYHPLLVDVEMREWPQTPKIVDMVRVGFCGSPPCKFWEEDV